MFAFGGIVNILTNSVNNIVKAFIGCRYIKVNVRPFAYRSKAQAAEFKPFAGISIHIINVYNLIKFNIICAIAVADIQHITF